MNNLCARTCVTGEYGTGHEIRKVCETWESAEVVLGG